MHPGKDGREPEPIILPMFRTAGMPEEMSDLVSGTATMLSEAILALIENDHEIVEKGEAAEFRTINEAAPVRNIPVYARTDRNRQDPLFILSITNQPYVVIDEKQLYKGLEGRMKRSAS